MKGRARRALLRPWRRRAKHEAPPKKASTLASVVGRTVTLRRRDGYLARAQGVGCSATGRGRIGCCHFDYTVNRPIITGCRHSARAAG